MTADSEGRSGADTTAPGDSNTAPQPAAVPSSTSGSRTDVVIEGCRDDIDCVESHPACFDGTCVACLNDSHCGQGLFCLPGANEEHHRCVECAADRPCGEGKLCVQNECLACDPGSHAGCDEGYCAASPVGSSGADAAAGPACVACLTADHCDSGVCVDQQCAECNPVDHRGCLPGLYCEVDDSDGNAACVECLQDGHCESGLCEQNICVVCSPDDNTGCPTVAPWCLAAQATSNGQLSDAGGSTADEAISATNSDAGTQPASTASLDRRCVECVQSDDCASPAPYCVSHMCQACDPENDLGCTEAVPVCAAIDVNITGERMTDAGNRAQASQWQCVECAEDPDCSSGRCLEHTCVQCIDDTDCGRHAPRCSTENTCQGCESDSDCKTFTGTKACNVSSGVCVECVDNDHCSPAARFCDSVRKECFECTERDYEHCEGGCVIVPGEDLYQCADKPLDAGAKAECGRCLSDIDCETGSGYECVHYQDEERCLLRSSEASECPYGAIDLTRVEDDLSGQYCSPDGGC